MWYKFVDEHFGVKVHYIDAEHAEILSADLKHRYKSEPSDKHCELGAEIHFEPGGHGMYYTNQPMISFRLEAGELEIEAAKAQEFLFELKNAEVKKFPSGREYYKCYSRFACLCLMPGDRESLMFQLQGKMEEANEAADKFFAEAEKSWAKMAENYKEEHGQDFPVIRAKDLKKDPPN